MNTFTYEGKLGFLLFNFKEMIETDLYFEDIRFELYYNSNIRITKKGITIGEINETLGCLFGKCEIMTDFGKMEPNLNIIFPEDLKNFIKYLEDKYNSSKVESEYDTSSELWVYKELKKAKDSGEQFDFKEMTYIQMIELSWNQNLSDSMIAEIYDVGYKSVYNKRAKWNLQLRNIPPFHELRFPGNDIKRVLDVFPVLRKNEYTKKRVS